MAKGTLSWDTSIGLTGLYNALNSLGFITAVCGTPTAALLIFTGSLCESGTYIRIRLNSKSVTTNNGMAWDIGTVNGTTYSQVREGSYYNSSHDLPIARYDLFYDTDLNIVVFSRSNGTTSGENFVFCSTNTGLKLGFTIQNWSTTYSRGIIPIDASITTDYYVPNLFRYTMKITDLYLEQDIYLTLMSNQGVLMDSSVPAKINGISNISLEASAIFLASTDWVLFSGTYIEATGSVIYNVYTFLKVSLITA